MIPLIDENIEAIIEGVGIPLQDFEGKRVLITGSCGFLGSWFMAVFQSLNKEFKNPCKVVGIDSFIATDQKNHIVKIEDPNIKFLKADISDPKSLNMASTYFGPDFDYIIHAAGIASPIYYRQFPIETIDGMVLGLRWLLKHATDFPVKSFLYFSSSEMYGNPHSDKVPTKEEYYGNVSCIGPRSCYDESKRMGETLCHTFHRIHNIPIKWVRPFNVFGPGMRLKDDRVAPKFMFNALQSLPITVHTPGVQTRTLCYITDAMIAFLKAMLVGKNGEVYNIGNPEGELTMLELAEKVKGLVGEKVIIEKIEMPTEYPQDQAQRRCPDISKAKEELNYQPKINLDEGLSYLKIWAEFLLKESK